jgi:hypothetical protein
LALFIQLTAPMDFQQLLLTSGCQHVYFPPQLKHFEDVEKGEVAPDAAPTAAAVEAAKEAAAAVPAAPAVPTTTTRPLEKPDDEVYTVS